MSSTPRLLDDRDGCAECGLVTDDLVKYDGAFVCRACHQVLPARRARDDRLMDVLQAMQEMPRLLGRSHTW